MDSEVIWVFGDMKYRIEVPLSWPLPKKGDTVKYKFMWNSQTDQTISVMGEVARVFHVGVEKHCEHRTYIEIPVFETIIED